MQQGGNHEVEKTLLRMYINENQEKIITRLTDSKESTDHAWESYIMHNKWSSKKEHRADALALRAEERRDKLR